MIKFRRFQIASDIEIVQRLNPLLLSLQKMNGHRVRPELVRAPRRRLREVVHGPFRVVPILPPAAVTQPLAENLVFGSF